MNGNQFNIIGSWPSRATPPAEIGVRVLQSLHALSSISRLFQPWWFADHSLSLEQLKDLLDRGKIDEASLPVDAWRGKMTELVERNVARDDFDNPEPDAGYSVSAYNSLNESSKFASLTIRDGSVRGSSTLSFETASKMIPDPAIVSYSTFKAALVSLATIWQPDSARAYPHQLYECWRQIPWSRRYDLSWMVYLSAPLASRIKPPSDVCVEQMPDGGLLIVAAEETFNVDNPKHMAAARSIVASLEPFNAEQHEEDRKAIARWSKGNLVSRLLELTVIRPNTDASCLRDVPREFKEQMGEVIEDLLSENPDDASLANAWRDIAGPIVNPNINLRERLETFAGWLQADRSIR